MPSNLYLRVDLMLNFLFWNLKRQQIHELVAHVAHENEVDILILAECEIPNAHLLSILNLDAPNRFRRPLHFSDKIVIYTRFPGGWMSPLQDEAGISYRHLIHPVYDKLLIVAVHLPSKLHLTGDDQAFLVTRLRKDIEDMEIQVGHQRTIVVGDLNMNPFETGVVNSEGLHGVMDRSVAQRRTRTVGAEERAFFYNPMWALFGDGTHGPSGTYYYNHSNPINYFWNIFDQVLIRPDLIPYFHAEELRIVTTIGGDSLLTSRGLPNKDTSSDHLPIFFRLNLPVRQEND